MLLSFAAAAATKSRLTDTPPKTLAGAGNFPLFFILKKSFARETVWSPGSRAANVRQILTSKKSTKTSKKVQHADSRNSREIGCAEKYFNLRIDWLAWSMMKKISNFLRRRGGHDTTALRSYWTKIPAKWKTLMMFHQALEWSAEGGKSSRLILSSASLKWRRRGQNASPCFIFGSPVNRHRWKLKA